MGLHPLTRGEMPAYGTFRPDLNERDGGGNRSAGSLPGERQLSTVPVPKAVIPVSAMTGLLHRSKLLGSASPAAVSCTCLSSAFIRFYRTTLPAVPSSLPYPSSCPEYRDLRNVCSH